MLRNILAVTGGVLAGALAVFLVEAAGRALFPVAQPIDLSDPAAARAAIEALPFATKFAVVVAWFAGALCGGVVAAIASKRWAPAAWVVAATMALFAGATLRSIPHPWWMLAGAALGPLLGGWLAVKVTGARYGAPAAGPRDPIAGL
jgi:hypothetical protein